MINKKYNKIFEALDNDETMAIKDMAHAMAMGRDDPVFFGEYFLGLQFHPAQKVWLWLTTKTQIQKAIDMATAFNIILPFTEDLFTHPFLKNILCPSNRFGKTFVTAIKHIWYNFYKIGVTGSPEHVIDIRYVTLNLSPHSMQVDAAYRYIIDIFQDRFIYMWQGKKMRNHCLIKNFLINHTQVKREITFANNCSIKGAPTGEDKASSLAGAQFFYISYDEAPQSLWLRQELPAKIQSRLIDSGGPLDIIGTPEVDKPSHVYYQRIVKHGLVLRKGFFTLIGKLDDNIFIGKAEKDSVLESIKQTDPERYRQVAFGEFISSGAKLLPIVAVERLFNDSVKFERGMPGQSYIAGIDWGFSDTGDPTVLYVFDFTPLVQFLTTKKPPSDNIYYRVVFRESIKGGSPYAVLARVRLLQDDFNDCFIIHDSSSMGGTMIKKMLREMHVRHIYDFSMEGSRNAKDEMLFLMARALTFGRQTKMLDNGRIEEINPNFGKVRSYYIPELEEQLGNYKLEDKKLEQDDVIAFSLPLWYCERKMAGRQTKVFDLNILADKPEDIIAIPGENKIKTRAFNLTEKVIS